MRSAFCLGLLSRNPFHTTYHFANVTLALLFPIAALAASGPGLPSGPFDALTESDVKQFSPPKEQPVIEKIGIDLNALTTEIKSLRAEVKSLAQALSDASSVVETFPLVTDYFNDNNTMDLRRAYPGGVMSVSIVVSQTEDKGGHRIPKGQSQTFTPNTSFSVYPWEAQSSVFGWPKCKWTFFSENNALKVRSEGCIYPQGLRGYLDVTVVHKK